VARALADATARAAEDADVVAATPDDVRADAEKVPEFDKIRTPDSPAFTLLGVTPTQIERPNTPKEVVVSLGTFVSKDSLTIPEKLALEFSPYWIWSHPRLTLADYGRTDWRNIYRNLTLSIGTSTATATTIDMAGMPVDVSNTDLAVGFRTHLYQQEQRQPCAGRVEGLQEKLLAVTNRTSLNLSAAETERLEKPLVDRGKLKDLLVAKRPLTDEEKRRLAAAQTEEAKQRENDAIIEARRVPEGEFNRARKQAVDETKLQAVLQARKEQLVEGAKQEIAQLDELFVKCAELEAARKGFLWDLAGAAAGRFPDASVEARDWLTWALWTSLAYEGEAASVVAMGRFQRSKALGAWDGYGDAGLRGIVARRKYALSLEVIGRWHLQNAAPGEERGYYRVAVAADYQVFGESWLSVGFGKDFATSQAGSLFTLANLKWGFGKPTVTPPK
jgi:hypothetical protein